MSVKSTTKPAVKTDAHNAVEVVVQIADLVLTHLGADEKPTLTAISRTTARAAGLLLFKNKEEKIAAENAAAVQIARRSNLI
jgi:hypothetical protein